jgi:hypothetical protein
MGFFNPQSAELSRRGAGGAGKGEPIRNPQCEA